MIGHDLDFNEYSIRQTALQMAIQACGHDPWNVVRVASDFEAYLRGTPKAKSTNKEETATQN